MVTGTNFGASWSTQRITTVACYDQQVSPGSRSNDVIAAGGAQVPRVHRYQPHLRVAAVVVSGPACCPPIAMAFTTTLRSAWKRASANLPSAKGSAKPARGAVFRGDRWSLAALISPR